MNYAVESLVQRISPSVVQIVVSGYGSTQDSGRGETSVVVGRQRTIGSGVIVDPDGYIVTNAHVVKGAEKIEVIVTAGLAGGKGTDDAPSAREQTF
ncbi:MAG: trypsin-like peptidase domain-containing protein, partial [Candidatus Acidiferrales bacterium]